MNNVNAVLNVTYAHLNQSSFETQWGLAHDVIAKPGLRIGKVIRWSRFVCPNLSGQLNFTFSSVHSTTISLSRLLGLPRLPHLSEHLQAFICRSHKHGPKHNIPMASSRASKRPGSLQLGLATTLLYLHIHPDFWRYPRPPWNQRSGFLSIEFTH